MSDQLVEIRCPSPLRHLFMKMKLAGEQPRYTEEENWIEITCNDCLREQRSIELRDQGHTSVLRVYHYFSFMGELMKTTVQRMGDIADS